MRKITWRNNELLIKINEKVRYWRNLLYYYSDTEQHDKYMIAEHTLNAWYAFHFRVWGYD